MTTFLDTNVLIRFLTRDDEAKYQKCFGLLKRVESGDEQLETSHLAIAEVVWVLQSGPYRLPRSTILDLLAPIVALRNLRIPDREILSRALAVYAETGIDFIDAYNAVVMRKRGLDRIYSYDTDFDGVSGITRVDP